MPGGGYALPGLQNIPLTPALSQRERGTGSLSLWERVRVRVKD